MHTSAVSDVQHACHLDVLSFIRCWVGQYKEGEANACHLCVLAFTGCRVGQYKEGEGNACHLCMLAFTGCRVGQYKEGEGNACHLCVLTFTGCRVGQYKEGEAIESAQEFARRIFLTCYMGTVNSGGDTKRRAAALAEQVRLDRHKPSVLGCRLLAPSTTPMQSSTSQAQLACHWQEARMSASGQMSSKQTNKIVCCVDWS